MKIAALLLASVAAGSHAAQNADVLSGVNWARQHGCNVTGTRALSARLALQDDPRLRKAARRLADGASLREALSAEGYLAAESSELHLSGAVGGLQIAQLLAAHFCSTLTNPNLREIGAERRGGDVWLVLAASSAIAPHADPASVAQRILSLVNAARAAGRHCGEKYFAPVQGLKLNARLTSAALAHSLDMAQNGEFGHRGHDGSSPASRVEQAGYGAPRIVGENIAAGALTPDDAAQGWLASPPHCENIMDRRFTEIGIAYAVNLASPAGIYWTQDFGAPH